MASHDFAAGVLFPCLRVERGHTGEQSEIRRLSELRPSVDNSAPYSQSCKRPWTGFPDVLTLPRGRPVFLLSPEDFPWCCATERQELVRRMCAAFKPKLSTTERTKRKNISFQYPNDHSFFIRMMSTVFSAL